MNIDVYVGGYPFCFDKSGKIWREQYLKFHLMKHFLSWHMLQLQGISKVFLRRHLMSGILELVFIFNDFIHMIILALLFSLLFILSCVLPPSQG